MRRALLLTSFLLAAVSVAPLAHAETFCMAGADRSHYIPYGEDWNYYQEGRGHVSFLPQEDDGAGYWGILFWDGLCILP